MPQLSEILALFEQWYPARTAEGWDAVGLVAGDPAAPIGRLMLAVDPAPAVAVEAAEWGADLLVVHHPLFLRAVHGFPATTPKGRTLARLVGAGCALFTAHTNADHAVGGVSEALALALGMGELSPILPAASTPLDKLVVFVPPEQADRVREALADVGAGRIGNYDRCSFTGSGEGRFRALDGARPAVGEVGTWETVAEERVEVVLPRSRRTAVLAALRAVHPYEEPAVDVYELADSGDGAAGTGRYGTVEPTTVEAFARTVAQALPATAQGVRVTGDRARPVRRVAVCGGAGDFLLDEVAGADVDVFVTSDLRHHRAAEFVERDGPALVDVSHWAGEWTWLPELERRLHAALAGSSPEDTVETRVSRTPTDPWSFRTERSTS